MNNALMNKMQAKSKQDQTAGIDAASNPALGNVALLAEKQLKLEDEIEEQEKYLRELNEKLNKVSTIDLPTAMQALRMKEFTMTDGSKVEINKFYSAGIKEENKPKAFKWLRDNGYGSLIKTELSQTFGKGEGKAADACRKALSKIKQVFNEKEGVHASSLKAFVREQLEEGAKIPMDLFGAFVGSIAKIKRPKT